MFQKFLCKKQLFKNTACVNPGDTRVAQQIENRWAFMFQKFLSDRNFFTEAHNLIFYVSKVFV